jgi:hypothetical protein
MVEKSEHWFSKIATETANLSGRPWTFGIGARKGECNYDPDRCG